MEKEPTIQSLTVSNLLSFGQKPTTVELGNLNVLIGPNGSGKSNFIEVLGLLQGAPKELSTAISNGGGIDEWLWKGSSRPPVASIEAIISRPEGSFRNGSAANSMMSLRYRLSFSREGYRFHITDELVENKAASIHQENPFPYFRYVNGRPMLNLKHEGERGLRIEEINPQVSILAQRKDPEHYPEITYLGEVFAQSRFYRDWEFGGLASVREPCDVGLPNLFLDEDGSNLGVVLDRLLSKPEVKGKIIDSLRLFYDGANDLRTSVDGGKVQTRLEERHLKSAIPLMRLSDGTVRWLSLLSILLNPDPPPLVCIEEPELGLHPDMIQELGRMLIDAATRMQLVITTHSDTLLETFSDRPDCVLVCEKELGSTRIERLNKIQLSEWLSKYSLGQLWRKGEIGGNRW